MGCWEAEETIYGPRERWVPDYRDDVPTDPKPGDPSPSHGIIPPPCPGCVGEFWRWLTTNAPVVEWKHQRALKHWRCLPEDKRGPEPELEPVTVSRHYQRKHYKGCTGQPKEYRTSGDDALELRPHIQPDEY